MKVVVAYTYIQAFEAVAQILKNRSAGFGRRIAVVVPDRFSLEAEQGLFDALECRSMLDTEVTTVNRITGALLKPGKRYLSAEGAAMAVADILERRKGDFFCFGAARPSALAKELYATIAQLQSCGVVPEQIASEGDDALSRKAHDIRIVYSEYNAFLEGGFYDAGSKIFEALKNAPHDADVARTQYYFVGFDDMTKTTLQLLDVLDKAALGVTAAAVAAQSEIGTSALFYQLRSSFPEADTETLENRETPLKQAIGAHFFQYPIRAKEQKELAGPTEKVMCYCSPDPDASVEYAARAVSDAVANGGLRYRDIAVAGTLDDVGESVFAAYGIPVNVDRKTALSAHPFVMALVSTLNAVKTRLSTRCLRELAANWFFGVGVSDYACWDNYCEKYSIDHYRHASPYKALRSGAADREKAEHEAAEQVRQKLVFFVKECEALLAKAVTAAEKTRALKTFADKFWERYQEFSTQCPQEYLSFHTQAAAALESVLGNLELVSSPAFCSLEQFAELFETGAKNAEISLTPSFTDAVNVFSPDSFGFRKYKLLLWLNANESVLPYQKSDCGLITDTDIDRLAALGTAVEPKIRAVNARGRHRLFSTLFMTEKLTVIYAGTDGAAHAAKASGVADYLIRLLKLPVRDDSAFEPERYQADPVRGAAVLSFLAPSKARAEFEFLKSYTDAARALKKSAGTAVSTLFQFVGGRLAGQADARQPAVLRAKDLFFGSDQTSVSQLETYFSCPYLHFLKYGLRAKERPVGRVQAFDIGTALHYVAEKWIGNDYADTEAARAAADKIVTEYFEENTIFQQDTVANVNMRAQIRLESGALSDWLFFTKSRSDFVTEGAERKFGDGRDYPPLPVEANGVCVRLRGAIDRIDRDGEYAAVLDYKTGHISDTLSDVYFGKKIQLFVYLRILERLGAHPAAALYVPVGCDYENDTAAGQSFRGWVVADAGVAMRLDNTLTPGGAKSEFLPVRIKKPTTEGLVEVADTRCILKEDEFVDWLSYAEKVSQGAVKEILDGYIAPTPFCSDERYLPCDYCTGKNCCRCDGSATRRLHTEKIAKSAVSNLDGGRQAGEEGI